MKCLTNRRRIAVEGWCGLNRGRMKSLILWPLDSAEPRQNTLNSRKRVLRFIGGINDQFLFLLPQEQQTQRMIDVRICQKNSRDRTVPRRVAPGVQLRHPFDLSRQIRRCIDEEPALNGSRVTSDSDAGLRLRGNFPRARGDAVRTGTVPLRQATAGCAAENMNANQPKLRSIRPVRSHRARVTCALKENWHGFQHRFDPAFFGSSHESP
jgi:hypothetical protein